MLVIKSIPGLDGRYLSYLFNGVKLGLPPPDPSIKLTPEESHSIPIEVFRAAYKKREAELIKTNYSTFRRHIHPAFCHHVYGWTLNIIARLYSLGATKVIEITDPLRHDNRKLFWERERKPDNEDFFTTCSLYSDMLKMFTTQAPVKDYAEKCFKFQTYTYQDVFNPTIGIEIIEHNLQSRLPPEWKDNYISRCNINNQIIKEIDKYKYTPGVWND